MFYINYLDVSFSHVRHEDAYHTKKFSFYLKKYLKYFFKIIINSTFIRAR
jgi:hypothetical protein